MIRKPAVAGQFYPASKAHLEEEVKKYLSTGLTPQPAIGVISPHAGYIYSGHVAGAVFSAVKVPERVIILSPNHTGMGAHAAIMKDGEWALPTGNIRIDSGLASDLIKECNELQVDHKAHLMEHSLEVQLPFLQARQPNLRFVPITVSHVRYEICEEIGRAIARVIARSFGSEAISQNHLISGDRHVGLRTPRDDKQGGILIVASSDMTHYEPHEVAKEKDARAIERVLALDAKGLLDVCARQRITMCGVIPTAIMLIAAKELGATKGELIKYATSGDISGDYGAVVGYAGITLS